VIEVGLEKVTIMVKVKGFVVGDHSNNNYSHHSNSLGHKYCGSNYLNYIHKKAVIELAKGLMWGLQLAMSEA